MKLTGSILTAMALAAGCGKVSKDNDGSNGVPDVKDLNLVGTWERGCEKIDLLGLQYRKVKLVMGGLKDYTREQTLFGDSGCNDERFVEKQTGTWAIVGTSPKDSGAKQINFTVKDAFVNPRNDSVAKDYNAKKYCDITSWKNGEETKVTNANCASGSKQGQVIFDVARVEEKNLFFGKTGFFITGKTSDGRPEVLDRDRPYTKK